MKDLVLSNRKLQDMNPVVAGEECCAPGHRFGPNVRHYTLIHYVHKGKGTFYARGGVHPVQPGQAFLILPGEVTTYEADMDDPWHYFWIGFDGALSERFQKLPPVFSVREDVVRRTVLDAQNAQGQEYVLTAGLFQLYAQLFSESRHSNFHVEKAKDYIQSNYMLDLHVEKLAEQMNLDRRYLSRLFKERTGTTVQEYLIRVRMQAAARYLRKGFGVADTAPLCGYEDVSNFSRMFKKHFGISPAYWKNE